MTYAHIDLGFKTKGEVEDAIYFPEQLKAIDWQVRVSDNNLPDVEAYLNGEGYPTYVTEGETLSCFKDKCFTFRLYPQRHELVTPKEVCFFIKRYEDGACTKHKVSTLSEARLTVADWR